ncbi:hypothetical protein JCM8547_003381 [Rhodosporidiobolus lusitaniae]
MAMGKCNCGAVQVEIKGGLTDKMLSLCHCTSCRASTGSIFSVNLSVPTSSLSFPSGEFNLAEYEDKQTDSGNTAVRRFCKTCGSPVETVVRENPDLHYVKGGLFPPSSLPKPSAQIFTRNWEEWESKVHSDVFCAEGGPPAQ